MNLVALLEERARLHPERVALVDSRKGKDRVVSYGELLRRVEAGAAFLDAKGLGRGKTVLVFHQVTIELYEFLLSAFRVGARVMLADPSAGKGFISSCCGRLAPDGFFGSWKAQLLRWMVPGVRKIPVKIRSGPWFPGSVEWRKDGGDFPTMDVGNDEPALITFTSGSTGVPKAAVRTHGFLLAQHKALAKSLDFREGEVDLITLPVFVLANLASGLTSVIAATDLRRPGAPDVEAVTAQCVRHGVTRCAASPAFFEGMLRGGMPGMRKVYTGGAPVFPDLLERLEMVLPEAEVHSVYGSTEAEPIAHYHRDDEAAAMTAKGAGLCGGRPVEEIRLRVLEDRWGEALGPFSGEEFDGMVVENGRVGEIVASGDHVLKGYLDGVGDGETKIRVEGEVWHRTGDAGWVDERGRLWLAGRCAEKMRDGEKVVYPFAAECAMRVRFPDVRMAALMWKERRTLVVGKICGEEERLGISEVAREFGMEEVICVERVPLDRRHNAKVDYPELRKLLER